MTRAEVILSAHEQAARLGYSEKELELLALGVWEGALEAAMAIVQDELNEASKRKMTTKGMARSALSSFGHKGKAALGSIAGLIDRGPQCLRSARNRIQKAQEGDAL